MFNMIPKRVLSAEQQQELREWLDQIDQRKARYYETYEEDLSDTKTLRGSTVRYFTKQFASEGISRSEAIQRAKAYVDSPAYRSHFNYLRKGLSETRAKARKANSEFRRFSVTRVWRFFSTPVSCCAWKHPHRSRKSV